MADFWDKEEILGKLPKNNTEEIQIKKVSKNNKEFLDIRVFWKDKDNGEFKPSQKGVAIPVDMVDELKKILGNI